MKQGIEWEAERVSELYEWVHADTVWNYSNTECTEIDKNNGC